MKTPTSQQHAVLVLRKALDYGRPIDIPFATQQEAANFRFMLYNARKRLKAAEAKANNWPIHTFKSEYERLAFTIEELEDERWSVRIIPVDSIDLEIIDAETGEQLSLPFQTTAEVARQGLPTIEELMANTTESNGESNVEPTADETE